MPAITRQTIAVFLLGVLVIALVYSKFALTVGMIALIGVGVWPEKTETFSRHWKKLWFSYRRYLPYPALGLIFFIVLYNGLYSEDTEYWWERLRIKLPFLFLPLAFAGLPVFEKKQFHGLYYWLLWIMTLSCVGVGINYWFNYEEITIAIGQGRSIPTPTHHIRFSLLIVLAILGGCRLWQKGFIWKKSGERWLILGMIIFLFGFLHLLAVRSGLVTLYLAILIGSLKWVWDSGRKRWLPLLFLGFALLPFLAYQLIPSFHAKVNYTLWDWKMYQQGNVKQYSDAGRLISLELAWELFLQNPLLGVGAGDLKEAMEKQYLDQYPTFDIAKRPHNQFFTFLSGTGLLGLALFIIGLLTPLFYHKHFLDTFFLLLYSILLASFMVENTIENAVGVGVFLFFVLLELHRLRDSKPESL